MLVCKCPEPYPCNQVNNRAPQYGAEYRYENREHVTECLDFEENLHPFLADLTGNFRARKRLRVERRDESLCNAKIIVVIGAETLEGIVLLCFYVLLNIVPLDNRIFFEF